MGAARVAGQRRLRSTVGTGSSRQDSPRPTAARIGRFAALGAKQGEAWRCLAWQLLSEARALAAAGDTETSRRRADEARRMRRMAAKAAAFGRMCAQRLAAPDHGADGDSE